MSLHFVTGDIFATPDIDIIAHGANCRGVMGAGIAGEIARRWPDVKKRVPQGTALAGGVIMDAWQNPIIAHLFTQREPGPDAKLHLVNMAVSMFAAILRDHHSVAVERMVAIGQIGCGIGGLEWTDVKPVVERFMSKVPQRVLVFERYEKGVAAKVL